MCDGGEDSVETETISEPECEVDEVSTDGGDDVVEVGAKEEVVGNEDRATDEERLESETRFLGLAHGTELVEIDGHDWRGSELVLEIRFLVVTSATHDGVVDVFLGVGVVGVEMVWNVSNVEGCFRWLLVEESITEGNIMDVVVVVTFTIKGRA